MSSLQDRFLGHYRVVEEIGAGGMGVVYRARDERVGRNVALKVLPEDLATDPERLARFEREARVLGSLSHQNIATLYGVEEHEGRSVLVMELVEGETLAELLRGGPMAVEDVIPLARQLAEGLEAAHEHGVVHRDLKPGNVVVSPEGRVKILDFGLARALVPGAEPVDGATAPTVSAELTAQGRVLGTAPYMSPEQAKGERVDGRADIWAFGCVLYEMLTGSRPFVGSTVTEVFAAILKEDPEWSRLPDETPAAVVRVLHRCLARDPHRRLHDIADARLELEEALAPDEGGASGSEARQGVGLRRLRLGLAAAAVGLLGVALGVGIGGWMRRGGGADSPVLDARLSIELPAGTTLHLDPAVIELSPDGRQLAWVGVDAEGSRQLYLRGVDDTEARALDGTEGAYGPFFSPDGRWIAFFDFAQRQLRKVSVDGGLPTRICAAPDGGRGGTWGEGGEIVFSPGMHGGLARVSAEGGAVEMLTEPDRRARVKSHRYPHFLPGRRAVLFMVVDLDMASFNEARIEVLDLDSGTRTLIVEGGMMPRYARSGHLVFARRGGLMAAPFDVERLQLTGQPQRVLDGVVTGDSHSGEAEYGLGANGLLVYAAGGPHLFDNRFARTDRSGHVEPLTVPERSYNWTFDLSPDGHRLATSVGDTTFDIWVWDFERQVLSRLTSGWYNNLPVWSPDGERIVFTGMAPMSGRCLLWLPGDGSSSPAVLYESDNFLWPWSWSPDGRLIVFMELAPETGHDIWVLPVDEDMQPGEPRRILGSPAWERFPRFSPDGRWLAYSSDETGQFEVYLRPFTGPGPRIQVSSGGGERAVWGPGGDEILYVEPASKRMMRVSIDSGPPFMVGAPEALFSVDSYGIHFAMTPDGQQFIFMQRGSRTRPITSLRVVTDWFDELERLVPTR